MKSTQDGQLKLTYFANSSRSVAKDSKKKMLILVYWTVE